MIYTTREIIIEAIRSYHIISLLGRYDETLLKKLEIKIGKKDKKFEIDLTKLILSITVFRFYFFSQ